MLNKNVDEKQNTTVTWTTKSLHYQGQFILPRCSNVHSTPCKKGNTIILTDCQNYFTGWFCSKFAVKRLLITPSHLAYVATLSCDKNNVEKQAITDILQGSVAT